MRVASMLIGIFLLAGCGQAPNPAARPRPLAPAAARAAADAPAAALAKVALGDYPKHLDAVLKALAAKDQKAFTAAFERLLKSLVEALRGVSKALRTGPGPAPTAELVDRALRDFDLLKARYDALPGDLSLDRPGEKERLVTEMERTLTSALLEIATPPAPGGD